MGQWCASPLGSNFALTPERRRRARFDVKSPRGSYRDFKAKNCSYCGYMARNISAVSEASLPQVHAPTRLEHEWLTDRDGPCAMARERINNTCFAGGNDGHKTAAANARAAQQKCQDLIPSACK